MAEASIRIVRVLAADIERVFAAWTQPQTLARWLSCQPGLRPEVCCDPQVGGSYRIVMYAGSRAVNTVTGTYLTVEPPRALAFTWVSHGRVELEQSTVRVELRAHERGTELTLAHSLADARARATHASGWQAALAGLARGLAAKWA